MTIGFLAAQISRAGASALRVFELLDAPLEVADAPGRDAAAAAQRRASSSSDVRFRYAGGEQEILRGVSFTVEPGQLVALLGTTGSGKSTLINLIPRFYDVTGGSVLIDGARRARGDAVQPALADRRRAAGGAAVLRHGARQHRLRPAGRDARGGARGGRRRRRRPSSSTRCRRATTPSSASAASASPAGSGSGIAIARALLTRPAPADPRRQHLGGRRRDRGGDPGRARSADARRAAHRVRDRPAHLARCATPT